ncbi:sugar ABC transporter ATP-binding protein [Pararobbsia silviterrae]|uniref:Sugar ABC transporter ATP-binding protein n=1 Tax=Pararobbsia silviterrae TaxID=1792498 RepID=A0A494XYY2_9BURK|nr:sugar ABC transporter ATP-binding protein [Pararobbsia silviterrae]RKP53289.1 sugar ABC transporter ATP-binding protein [Pararobbsia silviterrae]
MTVVQTSATGAPHPLIRTAGVSMRFGAVQALSDACVQIVAGRMLSLLGHNGAGKSTLIRILTGTQVPTSGSIEFDGNDVTDVFDARHAHRLGIRCVFQEGSLCPNLTVYENARVLHHALRGWGWRNRARQLIEASLDDVFPGHGIAVDEVVGNLSLGQRQMVEIARAFSVHDHPVRLVILDEPTSSLDPHVAEQLLEYTVKARAQGLALVLISHKMREVTRYSDDVVVMRDGQVGPSQPSAGLSEPQLVALMGHTHAEPASAAPALSASSSVPVLRRVTQTPSRTATSQAAPPFYVNAGEIVGLAGLAGHGQREMLLAVLAASQGRARRGAHVEVAGRATFVAGDRQSEGLFPFWSVGQNLTIGGLGQFVSRGLIALDKERALANDWSAQLKIRTPDLDTPITALSGGNQQKVLVARALADNPDIVLLDDPLRGVDIHTKNELYEDVRRRAAAGCAFVWYTTENAELSICDRVYVFNQGRVTDEIPREALSEQRLIQSSFSDETIDVH